MRYLCIHCHFYQPPRENAWLEAIELQDSAYPYHDWNERIMAESYAPNLAARILDDKDCIVQIVNNYANISFNFGPTLLSWMADKSRELYDALIEADRAGRERFGGHGSAIAQCYNHAIMPLANARDKRTQIAWGISDFEFRFGRKPEGMWLPETAVDLETLDLLAENGILFTLLAPSQASLMRPIGSEAWEDVSGARIDPRRPYRVQTSNGRSITVFFYDGPVSRAVAFERLLDNGVKFADRLTGVFSDDGESDQLVHIATDGETYGHHHPYGEMALAYALHHIESQNLARITNYGQYLEHHPPVHEARIFENTAWSCAHGVGRWSTDCGCNTGTHPGWNQKWRGALRDALDWLRDYIAPAFESRAALLLKDPWRARNEYIRVILNRSAENRVTFIAAHALRGLSPAEEIEVWKLLEMQRHALLMYTSCGWFFDELSGIETVQVIEYAGRVVQLAQELFGDSIEAHFLERLAMAKSNIPEQRDGAAIYEKSVRPTAVDLYKLGAHYAISSLFESYGDRTKIYSYTVDRETYRSMDAGRLKSAVGRARFTSDVTQESAELCFGVVHFGDHNMQGGVRPCESDAVFSELAASMETAFSRADLTEVVRLLDRGFASRLYTLQSLFKDEQRKIVDVVLRSTLDDAESAFRQVYDNHAPLLRFLTSLRAPLPEAMKAAAEYALNSRLRHLLAAEELDSAHIRGLLDEVRIAGVALDQTTLEYTLRRNLERLADNFRATPDDAGALSQLAEGVAIARVLPFPVVFWSVQNDCYEVLHQLRPEMLEKCSRGDEKARAWVVQFDALAKLLLLYIPDSMIHCD